MLWYTNYILSFLKVCSYSAYIRIRANFRLFRRRERGICPLSPPWDPPVAKGAVRRHLRDCIHPLSAPDPEPPPSISATDGPENHRHASSRVSVRRPRPAASADAIAARPPTPASNIALSSGRSLRLNYSARHRYFPDEFPINLSTASVTCPPALPSFISTKPALKRRQPPLVKPLQALSRPMIDSPLYNGINGWPLEVEPAIEYNPAREQVKQIGCRPNQPEAGAARRRSGRPGSSII